jgi:hypothetical protein
MNANYNNFGFRTPGTLGIRNVGHDLGVNPTWNWTTTTMSNLISMTYNWSKYDETDFLSSTTTTNNSHTALLLYVPSFFNKPNFSTDASIMFFKNNTVPGNIQLNIWTYSISAGRNFPKQQLNLRSQLQYNITTIKPYTPGKNLAATLSADWNIVKRLSWNTSLTVNLYKYGDELTPQPALLGASYLENMLRTALMYRFGN